MSYAFPKSIPCYGDYVDGSFATGGSSRPAFRVSDVSDNGIAMFVDASHGGVIPCIFVAGSGWYNRADSTSTPAQRVEMIARGCVR